MAPRVYGRKVLATAFLSAVVTVPMLNTFHQTEMYYARIGEKSEPVQDLSKKPGKNKVGLCCIAKDEEPYIDEWVDYHLALGFNKIIVYDNADLGELLQWGEEKGPLVEVVPFAGVAKQKEAYLDCATKLISQHEFKWAAFFDVDEFLILNQHNHIGAFLEKYLKEGALGINWRVFGTGGRSVYSPAPVTKRFQFRFEDGYHPNRHVKSIANLRDINLNATVPIRCHYPELNAGKSQFDTNGHTFVGSYNDGPIDVAVIHHHQRKSAKEFLKKRMRGRATISREQGKVDKLITLARKEFTTRQKNGTIFDDSGWKAMKKLVPRYAIYDQLYTM